MSVLDPFKGFGVTFSHMFKKVVTEKYPEVRRPPAPRFHSHAPAPRFHSHGRHPVRRPRSP